MDKSIKTRLEAIEKALGQRDCVAIIDLCEDGLYKFVTPLKLAGVVITADELTHLNSRYGISHAIIDDL